MAASAWVLFDTAKHKFFGGALNLSGNAFAMSLFKTSAGFSAGKASVRGQAGIASYAATGGGYTTKSLTTEAWTQGASAGEQKFDCDNVVWTATGSTITGIRYAVIFDGSAGSNTGALLCYASLTSTQFNVSAGSTVTVQINNSGVFTLA